MSVLDGALVLFARLLDRVTGRIGKLVVLGKGDLGRFRHLDMMRMRRHLCRLDERLDGLSRARVVSLGMNETLGEVWFANEAFGTSAFPALVKVTKVGASCFFVFFEKGELSHHFHKGLNGFHFRRVLSRGRKVLINGLVLDAVQHLRDVMFGCQHE